MHTISFASLGVALELALAMVPHVLEDRLVLRRDQLPCNPGDRLVDDSRLRLPLDASWEAVRVVPQLLNLLWHLVEDRHELLRFQWVPSLRTSIVLASACMGKHQHPCRNCYSPALMAT